ncbi:hypothetical protein [Aquimarina aquimarini]|uniref:hypothetical protein n=1 Tax=Aquimarina aquimarini TaxID=1191734 RepID=UPI000D55B4BC|nr:hypothetical protein [Aquimarina aquimarini]
MKNKIKSLLLFTVLCSICFNACKDKPVEVEKSEKKTNQELEKKNAIPSEFSSALRPNEKIKHR